MATIRRDHLRRLCEAGRLRVVDNYHFDDMLGTSRGAAKDMMAAISPPDWHDRVEGICYLFPSDFSSSCGRAYQNPDGTVTLYIHSNCNYTFRIVEE